MNLWTIWLDTLRSLIEGLSSGAGLGLGLAVVAATLLLRTALLPLSWSVAYRNSIRQRKMKLLQPALSELKATYGNKPDVYMQQMMALYREHDLPFMDGKGLLGALVQAPLFLGMVQVLRNMGDGARFLWVSNLLKPDTLLALTAGATTALVVAVNPDVPEQMRLFMIAVPSIIAVVFALKCCSALSLYWVASNCFTAAQTFILHRVVRRRLRAGTLSI